MNKEEFKEAMKNPKNVYCLVSIDSEMVDLYVNRFKEAIHADLVSYGQIKPYGKLFKKKTLSVLYMPKLDESIFDRKEFIFIYTDAIDKRTAAYKQHKDQFIELDNDYVPYIMKHSNFSKDEAKQFAKSCNNDFGCIKNGLIAYNDSDQTYNRFTDYSSDIYGWVDAFLNKKPLPRVEESAISLMALLSTNSQSILRIQQKNTTGMNPYIINCYTTLAKELTIDEVVQIINDCFYLDCQIKKGLIDANDAINYLKVRRYNGITN